MYRWWLMIFTKLIIALDEEKILLKAIKTRNTIQHADRFKIGRK